MTKKRAAGTVGFIFIAIMLSKVLGQVREMVIASLYGTNMAANAYVVASQLPVNFFDMILGSAISSAFIPVYNMFIEKDGEKRANLFASRFLNLVLLITGLMAILGVLFSGNIIQLFAPLMDDMTKNLAASLLKIMFPMVIFTGLAFTLVGLLQSLGEFRIPAVMSLVSNLACILYLLTLNNRFGIYGLAVALTLGWVLQFAIMIYPARKRGYQYSLRAGVKDEGIKKVAMLALPVLFASWVQPINATINISIASGMENGGVAALNYANRLYIIAASVFAVSLTNYIFPKLSRLSVSGEKAAWSAVFAKSMKIVLLLVTPVVVIFLLQSKEIIRIIYQRGEFGEYAVELTSSALLFYSIGMLWFSLQEIFNKAFYSVQDTRTPMISAIGGILTNVALSFLLSRYLGIKGLALAASISAMVWSIFSYFRIRRRLEKGSFQRLQLGKIIIMGAAAAVAVYFTRQLMLQLVGVEDLFHRIITFAVPAAAGGILYVLLAVPLKIDETKEILGKFAKGGNADV